MIITDKTTDLDTFMVYSIALEEEAAEWHDELADMLDVHNNPGVAVTFRQLAMGNEQRAYDFSGGLWPDRSFN